MVEQTKYLPLILTVLTNAAAQIMLKKGVLGVGAVPLDSASLGPSLLRVLLNPWVFLGLATFVVSMASHLVVLSRVELSFAYPSSASPTWWSPPMPTSCFRRTSARCASPASASCASARS